MPARRAPRNYLLSASSPPHTEPRRLIAAVIEGNYKAPVTVLGGTIALSALQKRVCGLRKRQDLEDDVRVALAETQQRFKRVPVVPGDTVLICSSSLRRAEVSLPALQRILLQPGLCAARDELLAAVPIAERPDLSITVVLLKVPRLT